MYLGALDAFGPIKVNNVTYSSITPALDQALASGYPVMSADGSHAYAVQRFSVPQQYGGGSGWLLDGCPLNVIFGQGWISNPDQIGALKTAGVVPTCLTPGSPEYLQFFGTAPQGAQPAPPPEGGMTPAMLAWIQNQQAGEQPGGPSYTPSGARIVSTGVQVPAPTIVTVPGAPPVILPPTATETKIEAGVPEGSNMLLYAGLALAAFLLLRKRG